VLCCRGSKSLLKHLIFADNFTLEYSKVPVNFLFFNSFLDLEPFLNSTSSVVLIKLINFLIQNNLKVIYKFHTIFIYNTFKKVFLKYLFLLITIKFIFNTF
jgi:hypothetical protein